MNNPIKQIREKFRHSIRRQQLERQFKQNRMPQPDLTELLSQFETTDNQDELTNLIEQTLYLFQKNQDQLRLLALTSKRYLEIWIHKILSFKWNEIITISLINLSYFFDLSSFILQQNVLQQLTNFLPTLQNEKLTCLKQSMILVRNFIIDEKASPILFRLFLNQFNTFFEQCLLLSNQESEIELCDFLSALGSCEYAPFSYGQCIFKYSATEILKKNTTLKYYTVINSVATRSTLDFDSFIFVETMISSRLYPYLVNMLSNYEEYPCTIVEIIEFLTKLLQYEYPDDLLDEIFSEQFLQEISHLMEQDKLKEIQVATILLMKELVQYKLKYQKMLESNGIFVILLKILLKGDTLVEECVLKCLKACFKTSKYLTQTLILENGIQTICKLYLKSNEESVKLRCLKCLINIVVYKSFNIMLGTQ